MSLAELFYAKQSQRSWWSRFRSRRRSKSSSRITHHGSRVTSSFLLEPLEPRLLLSAAPAQALLPEGAALGLSEGGSIMGESNPSQNPSSGSSAVSPANGNLVTLDADVLRPTVIATSIPAGCTYPAGGFVHTYGQIQRSPGHGWIRAGRRGVQRVGWAGPYAPLSSGHELR
ncbi:MAG: LEPR-XLL domain-containing protein [Nitrospirae bacterium]|nr:LEPR-XLL domain-containing protein [Nitrospirota bacterium]